jgi:glycosyltransferase involved in cell wall biosynthesis
MELPKISCVCLTNKRPVLLLRAINCFNAQSYENKELVIVYLKTDTATIEALNAISAANIKRVEVDSVVRPTIGELRNISIEAATGDYFCQWDDDDWYHNHRLKYQYEAMMNCHKEANVLESWLMFDDVNKQVYLSFKGPWSASILCKKSLLDQDIKYPHLNKHEDRVFLGKLFNINCLYPSIAPFLYIHVYHGKNTWDQKHFNSLFKNSLRLSPDVSKLVADILNGHIDNDTASRLLQRKDVLKEVDYFYHFSNSAKGAYVHPIRRFIKAFSRQA